MDGSQDDLLEITGLSKRFESQQALNGVDLRVAEGRVEALVGHNGSGKSTLIKILSGFHTYDAGTITVGGESLKMADPVASAKAGLRFIHQDLGLLDQLTVLENLRLGGARYSTRGVGPINWRKERRNASHLLEEFGIHIRPDALISTASPVQRTSIAVARAMQERSAVRLLVLDEPTATLPDAEVEKLFGTVRAAAASGASVLYVSHRLEELHQICDHFTVLREGRIVGSGDREEIDKAALVSLITGVPVAERASKNFKAAGREQADSGGVGSETVLRLRDIEGGQLRSLNLDVRPGEVVGVAGLAGSGVHDIPEILLGRISLRAGTVRVGDRVLARLNPTAVSAERLAILPSARNLKSIPSMKLRENITLPTVSQFFKRGFLSKRAERLDVGRLLQEYVVQPAEPERGFATLSGGNQQKACVAKWMRTKPRAFVLDEPTAGVDVGGRAEILRLIREAANEGLGVLVCSSDLDDLADLCDRVIIVRQGSDVTELKGKEITRDVITTQCYQG